MTTDVFTREIEDGWAESVADAWDVLEPVREQWRDEDREVLLEDDERRDV